MDVRTLADVMPAIGASFGLSSPKQPSSEAQSPITPNRDVVLLLIDGLGAELLAAHRDVAPNLLACSRGRIATGFPATTASSLSTLATGSPCAQHGIVGYSFAVDAAEGARRFNALRWRLDSAEGEDARNLYSPEEFQPLPSIFQTLLDDGVDVHYVMPAELLSSGLTRASFRADGVLHDASKLAQVRDGVLTAVRTPGSQRRFVYAYYPKLDAMGHLHGPGSEHWRTVLRDVDAMVSDLIADLPSTTTLVITGDHGMVQAEQVVDLDTRTDLQRGVRLIAGEARVRHIYLDDPSHTPQAAELWSAELAEHATVVTREKALDERWYGDVTTDPAIIRRIGDLVAVARGSSVLVCPEHEPLESMMQGHHGAGTDAEVLVPLLVSPL